MHNKYCLNNLFMCYQELTNIISGAVESNPSPQERDNMFFVHMASIMDGAVKKWQCVLCGKMSKLKGDILDHVEGKHMDNSFLYSCRYCSKVHNTNRKLRFHEVDSCNSGNIKMVLSIYFLGYRISFILFVQNCSYYPCY